MRSGTYIQALGRQSFEPSQPRPAAAPPPPPPPDDRDGIRDDTAVTADAPPSEQSRERQRELVKAQNDVLATVGVCLRDTKTDLAQAESEIVENRAGLLLGAVDLTATYLASWPLIGIRNRLQVVPRPLQILAPHRTA